MRANKSYSVKEWFANKIANEIQRNISMCDVFAILKETEKAVYAVLNLGCDFHKTMWIPKSVLIENEIGKDSRSVMHYETRYFESYDEAINEFKLHWKNFK